MPTEGEAGGDGTTSLPKDVVGKIAGRVGSGRFDPPDEVKNRKFQTKESHEPTEKWVKKVWDEEAVPLMKEAGASDDDVKWAAGGLDTMYISTDRPESWRLQAATLLADGADKKDVVDRIVRSAYERGAADTDPRRIEQAKAFISRWDDGNLRPPGAESPPPWRIEPMGKDETIASFSERRRKAEDEYNAKFEAWADERKKEVASKLGLKALSSDPKPHGFPEKGWWGSAEGAAIRQKVDEGQQQVGRLEMDWARWRLLDGVKKEAESLVDEAGKPGKMKAALALRDMSMEAFKRDFPQGVTVYRGVRDEDSSKMPWRVGQQSDVVTGGAEKLLNALNEHGEARVKVDGWTSWSPVKKAAEEFMVVQHEGTKKPSATPAALMMRRKVTADDVQMYWKVGYAHNMMIDTAEVQLGHKAPTMKVTRDDVELVKGRDVSEPDWVKRPGKKERVAVAKARKQAPLVDLVVRARPLEWAFKAGEDEDVVAEPLKVEVPKVIVKPKAK